VADPAAVIPPAEPSALDRATKMADRVAAAARKRAQDRVAADATTNSARMAEQQAQQAQGRVAALESELARLRENPLEVMLAQGMTPEQINETFRRAQSPELQRIKALEDKLLQDQKREQQRQAKAQHDAALANQPKVEAAFIEQASDATLYPTLCTEIAEPYARYLVGEAMYRRAEAEFQRRNPGVPVPQWTNEEILLAVETDFAARKKARTPAAPPASQAGNALGTKTDPAPKKPALLTNAVGLEPPNRADDPYPIKGTPLEKNEWVAREAKRGKAERESAKAK
jgi:hypothetical protein